MKIGIMTFHCANNYGAVLQCYALQETLKSFGFNVKIINYCPDYISNEYKVKFDYIYNPSDVSFWLLFLKRSIKRMLSPQKLYLYWYVTFVPVIRYFKFKYFRIKYFDLTKSVNINTIPSNLNYIVFGSDQIWNLKITKDDKIWSGSFKKDPKTKLISYAASAELKEIDSSYREYFSEVLNNFDKISVREEKLRRIFNEITERSIITVLDPTLLASEYVWEKLRLKNIRNKKYILVYNVVESIESIKIAEKFANEKSWDLVLINASNNSEYNKNVYQSSSPIEFLNLFKYAEFVFTNSFHGTAFSIIFKKNFFTLRMRDGYDTRSESLLSDLSLIDRFIEKTSSPAFSKIDYDKVNNILASLKNKSKEYLIQSLKI